MPAQSTAMRGVTVSYWQVADDADTVMFLEQFNHRGDICSGMLRCEVDKYIEFLQDDYRVINLGEIAEPWEFKQQRAG